MSTIAIPCPSAPVFFAGKLLMQARWGDGFSRNFGWMRVYAVDQGGFILEHRDTALGLWKAAGVLELEDAAGFFGFCPRACTLYQALAIPVRGAA